jgi:hypothetical protein
MKIIGIGDDYCIRDVSRSNRCMLRIDRTLILKTGTVVVLGDHEIIVKDSTARKN